MRDIPGENTPENVQIIIDETTRLSSLVNDLLDISRLQSGTLKLEKEVFSITGAVREILGQVYEADRLHPSPSIQKRKFLSAPE